jgi:transporter family protein
VLQQDYRGYFYFKALQIGKVSQVAAVDKLSVAIAIILSILFFKETLTFKTAIELCLLSAELFYLLKIVLNF